MNTALAFVAAVSLAVQPPGVGDRTVDAASPAFDPSSDGEIDVHDLAVLLGWWGERSLYDLLYVQFRSFSSHSRPGRGCLFRISSAYCAAKDHAPSWRETSFLFAGVRHHALTTIELWEIPDLVAATVRELRDAT